MVTHISFFNDYFLINITPSRGNIIVFVIFHFSFLLLLLLFFFFFFFCRSCHDSVCSISSQTFRPTMLKFHKNLTTVNISCTENFFSQTWGRYDMRTFCFVYFIKLSPTTLKLCTVIENVNFRYLYHFHWLTWGRYDMRSLWLFFFTRNLDLDLEHCFYFTYYAEIRHTAAQCQYLSLVSLSSTNMRSLWHEDVMNV